MVVIIISQREIHQEPSDEEGWGWVKEISQILMRGGYKINLSVIAIKA